MAKSDENDAKLRKFGIDRIADMMREGATYRDVSAAVDVKLAPLWRWVHAEEERTAKVGAALKDSADASDAMAEEVLKGITAGATRGDIARARELAQHYRWRASKRNPKTYGERQQVEVEGQLDITLTEEQVNARILALFAKAGKPPAD